MNRVCKIKHDGVDGWFVPWDHPVASVLRAKKSKSKYPDVFEDFWKIYPQVRRGAKNEAYEAWINMPHEDRGILNQATENYRDYILVETELKWMKVAKNFIESGLYNNFKDRVYDGETLVSLEYWDRSLRSTIGYAPAWKPDERALAIGDIKELTAPIWYEKVWLFFSGLDPNVQAQIVKLGFRYKTFHSMLTAELMSSKYKKPIPCVYCGEIHKHDPGCPVLSEIRKAADKVKAEYQVAKDQNIDLKAAFREEVGRR